MSYLRLTLAALGFAAAATANAQLITYNFDDTGSGAIVGTGDDAAYSVSVEGVSLFAQGYKGVDLAEFGEDVSSSFDDTEAITWDVSGSTQGLGVDSGRGDDTANVDGDGPDEAVQFDLGLAGFITSIQFDAFGNNDDFSLVIDGVATLLEIGDLPGDQWVGRLAYDANFAIGADGASDEFRIRSLTVDVPEPASLGILGLSLVLLGLRRKVQTG